MKATIKQDNFYGRGECKGAYLGQNTAINSRLETIIMLQLYQTSLTTYCRLIVRDDAQEIFVTGTGQASGEGYNRKTAAVSMAFSEAGIESDESIDSRSDTAIVDALKAVMLHLGYRKNAIIEAFA